MKNVLLGLIFVSLVCTNLAHAQEKKDIVVTNSWVEVLPPVEKVTAAYMTITNNSKDEVVLDSVTTPVAASTQIHQMGHENGVMKMAMLKNLPIPANGKVELAPGGNHLMLINLFKAVNKGDIVPITLHFQDGTTLLVNAEAKSEQEAPSSSMSGMTM